MSDNRYATKPAPEPTGLTLVLRAMRPDERWNPDVSESEAEIARSERDDAYYQARLALACPGCGLVMGSPERCQHCGSAKVPVTREIAPFRWADVTEMPPGTVATEAFEGVSAVSLGLDQPSEPRREQAPAGGGSKGPALITAPAKARATKAKKAAEGGGGWF